MAPCELNDPAPQLDYSWLRVREVTWTHEGYEVRPGGTAGDDGDALASDARQGNIQSN